MLAQVVAESFILLHRNFRNTLRTPELFIVRTVLCVVIGLVLGSLFWNVGDDQSGVGKRLGYIAFTIAFFLFTSLETLPVSSRTSNMSTVTPWTFSNILSRLKEKFSISAQAPIISGTTLHAW